MPPSQRAQSSPASAPGSPLWRGVVASAAALFLPVVVFLSIALGLVQLNLEEVRALPKTYGWIASSMLATWLLLLPIMWVALGGRLEGWARAVIVLGVSIIVWDGFRGVWLGSALLVAGVAVLEGALLVALWVGLRRVETRTLLGLAGLFAVAQGALQVGLHVRGVGVSQVGNAVRELIAGVGDSTAVHPDPWVAVPDGAEPVARELDAPRALRDGVEIAGTEGGGFAVAADAIPGADLIAIPVDGVPADRPGVASLVLRVRSGGVGLGVVNPDTGQWFYRREAVGDGPGDYEVHLPLFPGATEVVAFNPRVGSERPDFDVASLGLHALPARIGESDAQAGNVYQILLDEAARHDFTRLLEEDPGHRHEGFTEYYDFSTLSGRTRWSLPQILSGSSFDPSTDRDVDEWTERSYQEGLFATLESQGVPVSQYALLSNHCSRGVSYCFSTTDHRRELLDAISDNFIIDLTFLRTLPNSVRALLIGSIGREPEAKNQWEVGFSVTNLFAGPPPATSEDAILREYYYSLNLFTVNFFQRMLVEEVMRPASGRYVFFHAMVPHRPWARDEACQFIPKEQRTKENAAQRAEAQTRCSLLLVDWFVEQLKLLDRYDDALIIVHSDHGDGEPPPGVESYNRNVHPSEEWPSWVVESLSAGVLLVKWPGASGFERSGLPVQSIDITPTVLEQLGLRIPDRVTGEPIQTMGPDFARPKEFFASAPPALGASLVGTTLDHFSRYERRGTSWTFVEKIPTSGAR